MKNTVFVISHLGSQVESLVDILNEHSRIKIYQRHIPYNHPQDLWGLWSLKHTDASSEAVYGDLLLYDTLFMCKKLYKLAKFIYFIREPLGTLREIPMELNRAVLYYRFRLRRICEMAKHTPNAIVLTHQDLQEGRNLNLKDYLNLKNEITYKFKSVEKSRDIPDEVIKSCDECYERYRYYLVN